MRVRASHGVLVTHKLRMRKAVRGLVWLICDDCTYGCLVEVDAKGTILWEGREVINSGDTHAAHEGFFVPSIALELSMQASVE